MTDRPEPGSIRKADLQQEWQSAFQEIEKYGIILLEVPEERAEEYALMLKEIMERIGSRLLYPVPVKAEAKVLATLAD